MEPSVKLDMRTGEEKAFNTTQYREAAGCLLYIALGSRLDSAYTVGVLGRVSANTSVEHWTAIKHVLRYLKATLGFSLLLIGPEILQNGFLAYPCGCRLCRRFGRKQVYERICHPCR